MKISVNEFRIDTAQPAEAHLDFATLCALLAEHQAATRTARLARGEIAELEHMDPINPAVAVLLAGPGQPITTTNRAHGSFHAAAAASFNEKDR